MAITSKFRQFYFLKFAIGHLLALASVIFLIFASDGEYELVLFIGIPICVLVASNSLEFYNVSKITISEKGILDESLFFKRKTFINFSEIKNIQKRRAGRSNPRGRISDGFRETMIELQNDKVLFISGDCYENYTELRLALDKALNPNSTQINRSHVKSLFFSQPQAFISRK